MNKTIPTETIFRTVLLVITLVNQALTMLGKNPLPFAEEDIYAVLTTIATIAAAAWAWWKNNSFTKEAVAADQYLAKLKAGNSTNAEGE